MTYYYVYIIKSITTGNLYKGYTTDYVRRLEEHNDDLGRYTKGKGPWVLIYLERYTEKTQALVREKQIKRYNRKYIEWLCRQGSNLVGE